ncbi:MAG: accessory factor UbiK family protein [Paracoccaceae bacterium]|nr:accessory factor UbiK family protein [Paracoccaceae bacterium]MDE2914117.1 accessory factor UbiK family protein [Paracoccaceae bacterium]
MASQNRILDDMSKLMTSAMDVAQGARTEMEASLSNWMDKWLADRDLVTREEFDAVRQMVVKAREENESLRKRVEALEAAGASTETSKGSDGESDSG